MTTYTAEELATRDDRRQQVCTMLLDGTWRGSLSRRELAKQWALPLAEVYRLEGEAAGAIRQARSPHWQDFVESKMAEFDELKEQALAGEKPDYKVAHSCIRTQLEIMGALKRPGDKVPAGKTDDGFDDMTAAQQAAMLRQAADELDGKRGPLQ